ncbi:MAG: hypothetical protein WDN08_02510 [Rhizomicrobium sp.]
MNEDDVPPKPIEHDTGFTGELGRTVGWFVWIAVFVAIAGGVLYAVTRWF